MKRIIFSIAMCLILLGQTAQGVTLSPVDSGTFDFGIQAPGIFHNHLDTSIRLNRDSFINTRAFAIFDLSGISSPVINASIEMTMVDFTPSFPRSVGFNNPAIDPALFDSSYFESVQCPPPDIAPECQQPGTGFDIFRDLLSGPSLGFVTYSDAASETAVLDAAGVELLNLALGNLFVIGISGDGTRQRDLFESPQLSLELVPVPGAVWLFGTALLGLVGFSGRRIAA